MKRTSGTLSARRASSSRRAADRAAPELLRVRYLRPLPPRPRDRFHPLEYGKEARQREDVAGEERLGLVRREAPSDTGSARRSGCRGPCTASTPARSSAPSRTTHARLPLGELAAGSGGRECSSPSPRAARHEERHRAPLFRPGERIVERRELLLPPDEGGTVRRTGAVRARESWGHLSSPRRRRRISAPDGRSSSSRREQLAAEPVEIVRDAGARSRGGTTGPAACAPGCSIGSPWKGRKPVSAS